MRRLCRSGGLFHKRSVYVAPEPTCLCVWILASIFLLDSVRAVRCLGASWRAVCTTWRCYTQDFTYVCTISKQHPWFDRNHRGVLITNLA